MQVVADKEQSLSLVQRLEKEYISDIDWEKRENANHTVSYSNFRNYLFEKLVKRKEVLAGYLPPAAVEAHFNGDIHIHKLPDSLWIPYCAGWSFRRILEKGLKTPTVTSAPAKHLDTAVAHLVNFFFMGAQEWTGAQAVSAFDLYTAPFVHADRLGYEQVKQILQGMLFELNYPARSGYQSPFTNITLVMDTSRDMLEGDAIVGGVRVGSLGDFVGEALVVGRALFELYSAGDAVGQPFTFPIPTLMLTRNFDWSGRRWGELTDLIFEAVARKGTAYFLNGYASNVEALYAMCCRLTIDVNHVVSRNKLSFSLRLDKADAEDALERFLKARENSRTYGIWALPDATGSMGVVTLNLPRIAYFSKGEWSTFEELLDAALMNARSVLNTWRKRYEASLRMGLMPLTREYLGHFRNHFSTIGVIGLPEAAANFMRDPLLWVEGSMRQMREAIDIEKRFVELIVERAREFEELDGVLYNVEEVPGESTGYRLASIDARVLKGACIPSDGSAVFYSNSVVPYYADVPLHLRALWEGEVQQLFTGGVMMHVFLGEQPDPEALRKLVHRLATTTKLVYFSITPTLTTCTRCGRTTTGYHEACPHCGNPNPDHWSRIVGYYRPVKNWNPGKKAEFKMRITY
jgi:ribonucleoside-triphosphate reductase